jgi:2-polyprenyl-6-methoxyphenol hydroxylase-like FAD-dependent oxidoreductase
MEIGGQPPGDDRSSQVLVVGAGPTGMIAACELLRRGVPVRIVDAAPDPVPYSKALLLWPRTIDVLTDLGLVDEVLRRGIRINAFRYYSSGRELIKVRFEPELASWALPQRSTEEMLRAKLAELGGCIERGVRLLALDRMDFSGDPANSRGITAILEHPDGRIERYVTPWLIGADGAGSAVRAQLGLGFTGSTYASHFLLADARVEGSLADDEARYYQSPNGVLVIVALPGGIFRFFASAPPCSVPVNGRPQVDLPLMQRLVDERGPRGLRLVDPEWVSVFRVHRRQAERFQLGRAFLVGDAAHVHSPAGGQGLNTGMQDAHNLAWKLAAVIHGEARCRLLDSYTPERHRVAARVVRDTDVQTRAWLMRHPIAVVMRDTALRLAHHSGLIERSYLPTMAGRRIRYVAEESTALLGVTRRCERGPLRLGTPLRLDTTVPPALADWLRSAASRGGTLRWTLLMREPAVRDGNLPQVDIVIAPTELAALAGCRHTAFVLVRPDGVVAARGHREDLPELRRWVSDLLTPTQESLPTVAVK